MKGVSCLMFEKYQMAEMQENINFGMGVLNGKKGKTRSLRRYDTLGGENDNCRDCWNRLIYSK